MTPNETVKIPSQYDARFHTFVYTYNAIKQQNVKHLTVNKGLYYSNNMAENHGRENRKGERKGWNPNSYKNLSWK